MDARAAAAQRTRDGILDAAEALFAERAFDEVTIADVASVARVSQQTVANHFGSKERLYLVGMAERIGPRVAAARAEVVPGDLESVVDILMRDYEVTGLPTLRLIASSERFETLAEANRMGRAAHHAWVRSALGPRLEAVPQDRRDRTAELCVVALDVRTWSQLRHDDGRSVEETRADLIRLLEALLAV